MKDTVKMFDPKTMEKARIAGVTDRDMRVSVKGENEITVFYDYGLSLDGVVTYYNTFEPYNITLK